MAAELLNAVKQGDKQVPIEILVRAKGSDDNSAIYKSVLDAIPGSKVSFVNNYSLGLTVSKGLPYSVLVSSPRTNSKAKQSANGNQP